MPIRRGLPIVACTLMQITAAIARAPHAALSIETVDVEPPRADEVLIEVVATGICHTDPAMRDQAFPVPQPVVLGHEGSGIVRQVGTGVTTVVPGDKVLISYNSCGGCPSCRANEPGFCHDFFGRNFASVRPDGSTPLSQKGTPIHGNFFGQSSFATFALAHERNVVKMPNDAELQRLCPLGCGIQTGAGAVGRPWGPAGHILRSIRNRTGGAERCACCACRRGRGHRCRRSGRSTPGDGASVRSHTCDRSDGRNVVTALKAITGVGVDFALDTTGLASVIRQATDALAPRGRCAILGASKLGTELTLDAVHMMTGGRHLFGTVEGNSTPAQIIPEILALHAQGRFPFDG